MIKDYNCIIIDDEPLARQGVLLHVDDYKNLNSIGEFPNAVKAGEFLSKNEVDIIFLDIEMPGISGLEFIRMIPKNSIVILTTAYPQYALEAFELDVLDYLLKPIKYERFSLAVDKAIEIISLRKNGMTDISIKDQEEIYIKSDRMYIKLKLDEITFIKGLKDYVIVHTKDAKYITALNVKTINSRLPAAKFARVSKSYIVNIDKIKSVGVDIIHLDGKEIPLGNSYKEGFLKQHINSKLLKR